MGKTAQTVPATVVMMVAAVMGVSVADAMPVDPAVAQSSEAPTIAPGTTVSLAPQDDADVVEDVATVHEQPGDQVATQQPSGDDPGDGGDEGSRGDDEPGDDQGDDNDDQGEQDDDARGDDKGNDHGHAYGHDKGNGHAHAYGHDKGNKGKQNKAGKDKGNKGKQKGHRNGKGPKWARR